MGKVKYPNPKFFKAKDRMDWAAQAENLKLVGGIFWDMFKETDWKKFGEGWKNILISDRDRIKEEYKAFAAASMKDKIDLILNGERHLGRLYRDGAMCTVRREWRGIKDTVYDFYEWARLWGMLLMSFSKDLIPAMNQTLYYRWMVSYFCCHSFMDKNILGLRGSNLRMSHELTYSIYRYVAENLVILAKGDRRNGNSEELNSKLVLIDEMTMAQIMAGFPNLIPIPLQTLPEFIICDEPVSALDVSIQAQILNLLMDLQDEKKLTYVFITHDLSVVKHISHEIMVMYLGQCVEYAKTEDLFKNPLHPYTKGLLDAVPIPSLKAKKLSTEVMRGELTSPVDPAPGCRFAARCPYATDACRGRDIPLKEVEPGHFVSCTRF